MLDTNGPYILEHSGVLYGSTNNFITVSSDARCRVCFAVPLLLALDPLHLLAPLPRRLSQLMQPGDSITLPGTDCTIRSEDAVDSAIKGRKVRGLLYNGVVRARRMAM